MLKIATKEDIEHIVSMLIKFKEESPYKNSDTNIPKIKDNVVKVLEGDKEKELILLYIEDNEYKGMLYASIQELPFSLDLQASEKIWYVYPKYRGTNIGTELYEAYEFWAKKLKVKYIHGSAPYEQLEKFYDTKEYNRVERVYVKWL